jgi:hypothetical protein
MKRIADGTQGLTRASNSTPQITTLTTSSGHINLFAPLESALSGQQLQLIEKKQRELAAQKEAEKGAALAPSAHDLTPWYTDCELKGGKERDMEKDDRANDRRQCVSASISHTITHIFLNPHYRRKQMNAKSGSDPLREMKAHLARRAEVLASPSGSTSTFKVPYPRSSASTLQSAQGLSEEDPARAARLARESLEHARAEALKARRKRELAAGSMTPSSVGETPRSEYDYRDVFNVKETREAREARERGRARHHWGSQRWDEDGDGDGDREQARDRDRDRGSNRERRVNGGHDRRR